MTLKGEAVIFASFPNLVIFFLTNTEASGKNLKTFASFHSINFSKMEVTSPCELCYELVI